MQEPSARVAAAGYGRGGSVFHAPLISVTPRRSLDATVPSPLIENRAFVAAERG